MKVEDVATGVGYFGFSPLDDLGRGAWNERFGCRGSAGEDVSGSNAGSREGAGRFWPATGDT